MGRIINARPLRIALVGCGRMGAYTSEGMRRYSPPGWLPLSHLDAVASLPDLYTIDAVCDIDMDRARATARLFNVEHAYSDYRLLLIERKLDALAIATRTDVRTAIITAAAENGVRGVHCEKPFARSIGECASALGIVRRHGVALTYGVYRRYVDAYRQAKEIILSGRIGCVVQVTVEHGRSTLMWSHPHSVDLLMLFSGSSSVSYVQADCRMTDVSTDRGLVDADPVVMSAAVQFENGVTGLITSGSGMSVRIYGEKGIVSVVSNGSSIALQWKSDDADWFFHETQEIVPAPSLSGTQRAFVELHRSIADTSAASISLDDILVGQKILMAVAYSSLCDGRRVALAEVPESFTVTGRSGRMVA